MKRDLIKIEETKSISPWLVPSEVTCEFLATEIIEKVSELPIFQPGKRPYRPYY